MKKLLDFKAVLFDIDRTLSNSSGEITDETVAAIKQLGEENIKLGVCTGRGVAAVKNKILPLFPKDSIHITGGGSQLVNSKGDILWHQSIDEDVVARIREIISNSDLVAVFTKADALYTAEPILSKLENHRWDVISKNLEEMSNDGVNLIYTTNLDDRILDFVQNNPNLSYKYMTSNSGNPYIDITPKGVNKAVALKKWCEYAGISAEKIIGFGDSLNDLEFLQAVGFSVAMENAEDEVKQLANKTIGNTDNNALAKYLTKIMNGENL